LVALHSIWVFMISPTVTRKLWYALCVFRAPLHSELEDLDKGDFIMVSGG
jgi:hypothetical protein